MMLEPLAVASDVLLRDVGAIRRALGDSETSVSPSSKIHASNPFFFFLSVS